MNILFVKLYFHYGMSFGKGFLGETPVFRKQKKINKKQCKQNGKHKQKK